MPRRTPRPVSRWKMASRRLRRLLPRRLWPGAQTRRRWWRTVRRAPAGLQLVSTAVLVLLAAMAQVEGSGNPLVRTYWRWSWHTNQASEVYRPASSAVGMYQITDGTFAEARRYCIHDHAVAEDGPWNDWHSCWFNSLYSRVVPSHAVELTSAYLDRSVATILERRRLLSAALPEKQQLAAVIHLCGAGAGDEFARHGFHLPEGQHCGDHEVRVYLARVN